MLKGGQKRLQGFLYSTAQPGYMCLLQYTSFKIACLCFFSYYNTGEIKGHMHIQAGLTGNQRSRLNATDLLNL